MSACAWVRFGLFAAYVVARAGLAVYDWGYDAGRASVRVVACGAISTSSVNVLSGSW